MRHPALTAAWTPGGVASQAPRSLRAPHRLTPRRRSRRRRRRCAARAEAARSAVWHWSLGRILPPPPLPTKIHGFGGRSSSKAIFRFKGFQPWCSGSTAVPSVPSDFRPRLDFGWLSSAARPRPAEKLWKSRSAIRFKGLTHDLVKPSFLGQTKLHLFYLIHKKGFTYLC